MSPDPEPVEATVPEPTEPPKAATADAPAATNTGDGPSSHDTCGQFPADEVRETFTEVTP